MKSKPELTSAQQKWVDALRSGKYKQGVGRLCTGDLYCCLGVACALFAEELGVTKSTEGLITRYGQHTDTAPDEVVDILGLVSGVGESVSIGKTPLAGLNDSGKTFEEIADAIETGAYFRPTEVG